MTRAAIRSAAVALLAGLTLAVGSAAFAETTPRLADGDNAGLKAALADAPTRPLTRIALAPGGRYALDESLLIGRADGGSSFIEIAGNGATVTLDDVSLSVGAGVTLRFEDTELRPRLQRSPLHPGAIMPLRVDTGGALEFERSAITGAQVYGGRSAHLVVVSPGGRLAASNSTIADNRLAWIRGGLLRNFGTVELVHVTIAGNRHVRTDGSELPAPLVGDEDSAEAAISVRGSIIDACTGPLRDEGGNLSSDPRCGIATTVDDLALAPLRKAGALVPTLAPQPWSPARGVVDQIACPATDARGLSRLGGRCDAGAHQSGAGAGRQDLGGINGTWFQPDNDGHYVVVNRNSPTELVVIWMTFDRDGNQAWVYSIADFDGSTAAGPAFVNRDGVLGEDGVPRGQRAEAWGTMRIRFDSCDQATLTFASDSEAFGSGTVALGRLSQVDSLGCAPLDAPSR